MILTLYYPFPQVFFRGDKSSVDKKLDEVIAKTTRTQSLIDQEIQVDAVAGKRTRDPSEEPVKEFDVEVSPPSKRLRNCSNCTKLQEMLDEAHDQLRHMRREKIKKREIFEGDINLVNLPEKSKGPTTYGLAVYKILFPDENDRITYIIDPAKASDRIALKVTEDPRAKKLFGNKI